MCIFLTDSPQREIQEEAKASEEEKEEMVEGNKTEKGQLEDAVAEKEKREESKEDETSDEEMEEPKKVSRAKRKRKRKRKEKMEGTEDEKEAVKRKKKRDKRTTAKRRKAKHGKILNANMLIYIVLMRRPSRRQYCLKSTISTEMLCLKSK